MRRHKLDVAPIPEKVLYINEPAIADRSIYDVCGTDEEINAPVTDEDNIRVYVPLDLNRKALLRRLNGLTKYGDLTTDSEMNYSCGVDGIITQVEIYDRIWYTREDEFFAAPDSKHHSKHVKELVREIISVLEEWGAAGSADCFPDDTIAELKNEYEIS